MQYGGRFGMPSAFNPQNANYDSNDLTDFINKLIVPVDQTYIKSSDLKLLRKSIADFYINNNQTTETKNSQYYMKQYTTVYFYKS